MSVQAMAWVIDNSERSGSEFVVLLMIANCADKEGRNAYPGITRLAKDARIGVRQAGRVLQKLIKGGDVVQRVKGGGRWASSYDVQMSAEAIAAARAAANSKPASRGEIAAILAESQKGKRRAG